jgi:hypothetical protein
MDMVVHRFNERIREDLARIAFDKPAPADRNEGDSADGGRAGSSRSDSTDDTHLATA